MLTTLVIFNITYLITFLIFNSVMKYLPKFYIYMHSFVCVCAWNHVPVYCVLVLASFCVCLDIKASEVHTCFVMTNFCPEGQWQPPPSSDPSILTAFFHTTHLNLSFPLMLFFLASCLFCIFFYKKHKKKREKYLDDIFKRTDCMVDLSFDFNKLVYLPQWHFGNVSILHTCRVHKAVLFYKSLLYFLLQVSDRQTKNIGILYCVTSS